MSRIGKKPVVIPDKVKVSIDNNILKATGPKGELELSIPSQVCFKLENNTISISRESDDKRIRSLHGLTRALTNNVIEGVLNGYTKVLQLEGVGYKVEMKGKGLMLSLGYSHPIYVIPPDGIQIASPNPNTIQVIGIDKQLVGEVSARIRKLRPPEPYKGKGIRYQNEVVRRKEGKKSSK